MRATMSLLGLYNYDNTILDGLILPDNFASGDTDTLKENLLMETAELEILYNDPTYLKYAITQWCKKNSPSWKWLLNTQKYEYNPIWNADYKISDRTDREIGNVGTSTNTNNYTRGLYEDISSDKDYTRNLIENENTTDELTHGEVIDNTKNSTLTHGYNSSNATTYASQEQTTHNTTDSKTVSETDSERHTNNDNDKHYTSKSETIDHNIVNTGSETNTNNVYAYNNSSSPTPESSTVRDISGANPLKSSENGSVENFDNLEIDTTKSITDTTQHTGTDTTAHTGTDTTLHSGTDTDTLTETAKETHSGKDKRDIDRDLTLTGGDSTEETSHDAQTGGTTTTDNGRTTSDTDDKTKYERWLRGNYGQTTTQQMIKEEQELAKFIVLDYIINDFKKRFCLMVY